MISPPADLPCATPSLSLRAGVGGRKKAGFTLIETALALGIVAFALIPIVGLLPIGLQVSRNAADSTMAAQIAQRLAGMLQQTDFSGYKSVDAYLAANPAGYYYFDGEGQPLTMTGTTVPPTAVYTACVFSTAEMKSAASATSVVNAPTVATLMVQITDDPAHVLALPVKATPQPTLTPNNPNTSSPVNGAVFNIPIFISVPNQLGNSS